MFFGEERYPRDLDGPWAISAFVIDEKTPHLTTFSICNVSPEFLEIPDFFMQGQGPFNPLESAGSLFLSLGDLNYLIFFMREFSTRLPKSSDIASDEGENSFSIITSNQKLKELHINREVDSDSNVKFYIQLDPPPVLNGDTEAVVLLLSLGLKKHKADRLFFSIMNISKTSLEDPDYRPLDYAIANMVLDRKGLEDLIQILQKYHDILLSNSSSEIKNFIRKYS